MSRTTLIDRLATALDLKVETLASLEGSPDTLEALVSAAETLASSASREAQPTASVADVAHIRQLLMSAEEEHQEQALALLDALEDEGAWTAIVQGCQIDEQGRFQTDELQINHSVFRAFCENPFADHSAITSLDLSGPWTNAYGATEGWLRMGDLGCLARFPALTTLDLSGNNAKTADMAPVAGLVGLTDLKLLNTHADAGVVRDLVNLVRLDLRTCQNRGDAYKSVVRDAVHGGEMQGWLANGEAADNLARLTALEELDIDSDLDFKLPALSALGALRRLFVDCIPLQGTLELDTAGSDPQALAGLSSLATLKIRAPLPQFGGPSLLDAVPSLAALTRLEVGGKNPRGGLGRDNPWEATNEALSEYQSMRGIFRGLREVDAEMLAPYADIKAIEFASKELVTLDGLRHLPLVETVNFKECRGLKDVTALGELEHLKSADLTYTAAAIPQFQLKTKGHPSRVGTYADEALKTMQRALRVAVAIEADDAKALKALGPIDALLLPKWPHAHIAGIRHLKELESFQVYSDTLTDLSALEGAKKLSTLELGRRGDPACTAVTELPPLPKGIKTVNLNGCEALTTLAPLPEGVDLVALQGTGIESFEAVTRAKRVSFGYNPNLKSLVGLPNTAWRWGPGTRPSLSLLGLPALESLEGIEGFDHLQKLTVRNCASLSDIEALNGLKKLTDLTLAGCPQIRKVDCLLQLPRLGDDEPASSNVPWGGLDIGYAVERATTANGLTDRKGDWNSWGEWKAEVRPAPPGKDYRHPAGTLTGTGTGWQNMFDGIDRERDPQVDGQQTFKPEDPGCLYKTELYAYLDKIRIYTALRDGDMDVLEGLEARVRWTNGEISTTPFFDLEEIDLGETALTTLDGLERFTKLTTLRLTASTELKDVTALAGMENLCRLALNGCKAVRPKPPSKPMQTREEVAAYQEKLQKALKKKKKG